jgi:poly-gamma-glutamate capsule biosynthesis protein CapA/YwtB (metallophosphatase superfamily)
VTATAQTDPVFAGEAPAGIAFGGDLHVVRFRSASPADHSAPRCIASWQTAHDDELAQLPRIPDVKVVSAREARTIKVVLAALMMLAATSALAGPVATVRATEDALASPLPEVDLATPPAVAVADEPPLTESRMPVVPVAGFWSKAAGLKRAQVKRALVDGERKGYRRVVVEKRIAKAMVEQLGIELHEDVRRLTAERVARAVSKGALGFVAATSLGPSMRTLEVDGVALHGNDRISHVTDWPLSVTMELPPDESWDQAATWVLVAGGDAFTDRGVYDTVVLEGKGMGYPFGGGTAEVTGFGCCDPVFNDNIVPRYRLTGNKGLVRRLFKDAELAVVNHEQPVTGAWAHHTSGFRFSGKPELTRIFTRAGIDYLSLANNHIGDYGAKGIRDSRRILRSYGLATGGAGADLDQARQVDLLEANGTQVAIIPCLDFVKVYWAESDRAGATPCVDQYIRKDIRKARRAGADVVIVFPHWGVEYTRQPLPSMRKHAARWVDAGADLVLGAHSHVAGAVEDIEGVPVLYSLGNLIFDQHWSTNTMQSALVEATFHGDRLVELRLVPYIIHDTSQPNLLDPAGGEGRRLLLEIKQASSDWLDW